MLLPSDKRPSSLFAFKIYLHHPSVTSFLSGVPPPLKKSPGFFPALEILLTKYLFVLSGLIGVLNPTII